MPRELRFCIGTPDGPHSSVWKIWTRRSDVYLSARALAADLKVSLHESGQCQLSRTTEWIARSGLRNCDRHLQQWRRRRAYPASATVHLFRVVIPGTELRCASPERTPACKVVWYPPPPTGHAACIELWLTPRVADRPSAANFANDLLGILTLDDGRFVGVTARYLEIEPCDQEQLEWLRTNMARNDDRRDPRSRGWALFRSIQAIYALVEYAPFEDEAA